MELSLTAAVAVLVVGSLIVLVLGVRMVAIADRLADVTGLGEAFVGAVLLGATTSLPDIAATIQPALEGFGEQAVGNALGGVLAQTAFLAIADITYRRANLEHAAASLPNLVQASVLVTLSAFIAIAFAAPSLTVGPVHVVTLVLPVTYWYGLRVLRVVANDPLWTPVETSESRPDEPDEEQAQSDSIKDLALRFGVMAAILGASGWFVGEAGQTVVVETGLSQGAVGAFLTAVSTSLAELVVSVAAVRRGALVLAVGNVLGGNTFDTLLMVAADVAYRDGSVYAAVGLAPQVLVAVSIAMTTILILGMLRRQRYGMGRIGTESAAVLVLYALAAWLVL